MRQQMLNMRQPDRAAAPAVPTVSSEWLHFLAMGAGGRGLDLVPIISAAAIDSTVLARPGARVSMRASERVWNGLSARLGDPLVGLRLVETVPFGAGAPIDWMVKSSPNVGISLQKLARFAPLMSNVERLHVVVSGNDASVRIQTKTSVPHSAEMLMGLFSRRSRDLVGPEWAIKEVTFAHDARGPREAYERICQAPVRFGTQYTEAVFDRQLLDKPMEGADPRLNAILTAQAEALLATVAASDAPPSFLETIEQALSNGLSIGDLTLVALADQLGLGVRTLQRRLRAEGLTHRGLVRKLRHDLAMQSLAASVRQNQIARNLGYSGTGAFQRAFKSWSGVSPAEARGNGKRSRSRRKAAGANEPSSRLVRVAVEAEKRASDNRRDGRRK